MSTSVFSRALGIRGYKHQSIKEQNGGIVIRVRHDGNRDELHETVVLRDELLRALGSNKPAQNKRQRGTEPKLIIWEGADQRVGLLLEQVAYVLVIHGR